MEAEREKEAVEPGQSGGISPALTHCLHGDGEKRLLGNLFRRQLTGSAVWVNGVEGKGKAGMACRFLGSVLEGWLTSRWQAQEKGQTERNRCPPGDGRLQSHVRSNRSPVHLSSSHLSPSAAISALRSASSSTGQAVVVTLNSYSAREAPV